MIYHSILNAIVSALAAEAIDNTSKQAWQKLYNSADEEEGGDLAILIRSCNASSIDRAQIDCWISARLHHSLEPKHWDVLMAKFSTHKGRKVQALAALQKFVKTPAPKLFLYKAVTAWAIPQLKGARPKVMNTVSIQIPLDAPAWRRESLVKAAVAAGKAKTKKDASRFADMIVLKDSFYDMNTWDLEANPESTRRRWRAAIHRSLDMMVADALGSAELILRDEGVLVDQEVS